MLRHTLAVAHLSAYRRSKSHPHGVPDANKLNSPDQHSLYISDRPRFVMKHLKATVVSTPFV